jgi:hypothetical protein
LRVAVPIAINGKAGLRGDIAKVLSLNGKNFSATVQPVVDITITHGADWCPKVTATPTQDWVTSANVEIIGRNCAKIDFGPLGKPGFCAGPVLIDLKKEANDAINGQQGAIENAATAAINCEQLRSSIQKQWKPIVVKIDSDPKQPMYLNIFPESLALSNVVINEDNIEFAVKAGVKAQLEAVPASSEIIPLPPLGAVSPGDSNLHFAVKAIAPYSQIIESLKSSFVNRKFISKTPAGDVAITAEDFDVYPSNGKLAVGVKFNADIPGRILDTRGWVYLTTTPAIANDGTAIDLRDLQYSAILDNKAWDTIVTTFDQKILSELKKNSLIDLRPVIIREAEKISMTINSANMSGVKIHAENPTAKIVNVVANSNSLVATVVTDMHFKVVVTDDIGLIAGKK